MVRLSSQPPFMTAEHAADERIQLERLQVIEPRPQPANNYTGRMLHSPRSKYRLRCEMWP